ncbi:aroma-sacti cluster domain-containing protein [Nonomuraea sp. NPDC049784]|uniref:aroma-sacti cluster domain-containing protein n=1 Tax=Nonomuraea sp. NPDC049784 TaxID=3154361 RepID=UPI0033E20358
MAGIGMTRLQEEGLAPGATPAELEALAGMSEKEFEVLKEIKARMDEAIGIDDVHSPQDGGLFW